jgi:hypothetical protein
MCGLCQNRNFRKERMIKHLRAAHGMPEGATPEECLCMDSTTVLFTSRLELDRYLEVHKIQGTHQGRNGKPSIHDHQELSKPPSIEEQYLQSKSYARSANYQETFIQCRESFSTKAE